MGNRRYIIIAIALALLAGGSLALFLILRVATPEAPPRISSLPTDPRLAYSGPFQNVHPSVSYVGSARCANCHRDIAASYRKHPMARTLQEIKDLAPTQVYDRQHNNPFITDLGTFSVARHGNRVWHVVSRLDQKGEPIFRQEFEIHFAIGSGNHGHSYLTNREGFLYQTPISWYAPRRSDNLEQHILKALEKRKDSKLGKGMWDLSPGFTKAFLRPIPPSCFYCHANRANPVEGTMNQFATPIFEGHGIGCERCHGPGGLHVAKTEPIREAVDYTIVNPRHLRWQLREAVCEQCHLEGENRVLRLGCNLYDFRPGMPLERFWSVFVNAGEPGEKRAVNHVEQMYLSVCFQRSKDTNKLGCISCHDPHRQVEPAGRVDYFRSRCLQCHAPDAKEQGLQPPCSMAAEQRRRRNNDSCIACHMTRYRSSDVVHNASTDHRILRKGEPIEREDELRAGGAFPISHFHRGALSRDDPDALRDLGMALGKLAATGKIASKWNELAVSLLEAALRHCPEDWEAWELKAFALASQGEFSQALAAAQKVLSHFPKRESSLMMAATFSQSLGQYEQSIGYWRRAIAVDPWAPEYHRNLAVLLADKKDWKEAQAHVRDWLRLEPESIEARKVLIDILVQNNEVKEVPVLSSQIEALQQPQLEPGDKRRK
jgi:Flp pilus assembly protein TadD